MQVRLDGRTALVTGGSAGLGLATATAFAQAGARVAILARRPGVLAGAAAAIRESTGGQVLAHACDVAVAGEVAAACAAVEQALGPVDILVNNAGRSARGAFEDLSDADWQADFDLKFFAAVRFGRALLPGMKRRGWGRVINVLNYLARQPEGGSAPTGVTRAAGLALTKVMAHEAAPHGVLVNALLVGLIESDQWVRRHAASGSNESYEAFVEGVGRAIPLGRMGRAEEFAAVACFLASDAAGFIAGTAIGVDGGMGRAI